MIRFTLKGPLQSWGTERIGNGDYFPTDIRPTKSGIIGLIACVMGFKRGDPKISELYDALNVYVRSHDNDGIITDFHIINVSDKRPMYLANGKKASGAQANSIITKRSYIQSGAFDIILDGEQSLLSNISEAFRNPFWIPYLGRKSCAASEPILPQPVDGIEGGFEELTDPKHTF